MTYYINEKENLMLTYIPITNKSEDYYKIKTLYRHSFPTLEQLPWPLLSYRALTGSAWLLSFYEANQFIGFAYIIPHRDILCIMFMAITPNQQGLGYGSQILQQIERDFKNYRLCLYMEELNPKAPNYEERIQRSQFYFRNGYTPMHYTVHESGVVYDMLAANGKVSELEYTELMNNFLGPYLRHIYHNSLEPIFTALKYIS